MLAGVSAVPFTRAFRLRPGALAPGFRRRVVVDFFLPIAIVEVCFVNDLN